MNYRSKQLLDAAKHVPTCMCCGRMNDGTVVAAHSNQQRDGKGKAIKAHDYRIAYLCMRCHADIDQGAWMDKAAKAEAWEAAHRKSIGWMFDSGLLEIGNAKV